MHKILLAILFLYSFAICENNPKIYSQLGDVIYDNSEKIKKLKDIEKYKIYSKKIDKYSADVENTKQLGFDIDSAKQIDKSKIYLTKLRELSSLNDYFIRSANNDFKTSIQNKQTELFTKIVNTGLIDINANEKIIVNFYQENRDDINSTGAIQKLLDKRAKIAKKRKKYINTKKQVNNEKIKRIREKGLKKRQLMEEKLSKELKQKKEAIRIEQERELFN